MQDEDDSDMANYDYGEEYLNRLSLALGGRTLVPQAFPIINKLLSDADNWKHLYCAAMAISIIGEGSAKTLSPHLSDILKYVPSLFLCYTLVELVSGCCVEICDVFCDVM